MQVCGLMLSCTALYVKQQVKVKTIRFKVLTENNATEMLGYLQPMLEEHFAVRALKLSSKRLVKFLVLFLVA